MKKDTQNEKARDNSGKFANQYKVFRLTHDGPEELDFVEWASDLTRDHPIAKQYQEQRKNKFEKIKKDKAMFQQTQDLLQQIQQTTGKDLKTPISEFDKTFSSYDSRDKTTAISPKSIMMMGSKEQLLLSQTPTPLLKTQSLNTRNHRNNPHTVFNLKLQQTLSYNTSSNILNQSYQKGTKLLNIEKTSNLRQKILNQNQKESRIRGKSKQYQYLNQSFQDPNIYQRNLSQSTTGTNKKTTDYLKQMRKHVSLVSNCNRFQNSFLNFEETNSFSTQNPINMYYQIAQNSDFSFKSQELFHPARQIDVKNLSKAYETNCSKDFRAARFAKSDYKPDKLIMSSYTGEKKQKILFSRCKLMLTKKKIDYLNEIKHQKDKLIEAINNKKFQLNVKESISADHNKSINDILNEEPEKPLTGYNYRKYFNEAHIVMNATQSALKLKNLISQSDYQMINKIKELKKEKIEVLNCQRKLKAPVININRKQIE